MIKGNFPTILCAVIAYAAALHMVLYGPPATWGWNGTVVHVLYDVLGRNGYIIFFVMIGTVFLIKLIRNRGDTQTL